MTSIAPINQQQQKQVQQHCEAILQFAEKHFQRSFPRITIKFDLKGRNAGMYCVRRGQRWIRFNPYLFAKFFDDNLTHTVPHEIAHYLVDMLYGVAHVRPHGHEWRQVMHALGSEPQVTCDYDLGGIPLRRERQIDYRCHCGVRPLGIRRHNKIRRGLAEYVCRRCRQSLVRC